MGSKRHIKHNIEAAKLKLDNYHLEGVSKAGIGTCICVPEIKTSFDVAQGLPFAVPMRHHLISHLHQDHAAGIPYLISQKAMMSIQKSTFYLPPNTAEDIEQILKIWQKLEGHTYEYELKELEIGNMDQLHGNFYVKAFETLHRVRSQGYYIIEKRKSLKKEFQDSSREEILQAKKNGHIINKEIDYPLFAFTGDSQIEFLDLSPEVKEAETLIMEVTYIDDKKPVTTARKWGHIHFDEVIERIPSINAKNIVFIHLSSRYRLRELKEKINEKLPEEKNRIHILN